MIPSNITYEHILGAINEIDVKGVPPRRKARMYSLVHANKRYPVKYVVELANRFVNTEVLGPNDFNSIDARGFLRLKGFQIIDSGYSDGVFFYGVFWREINAKLEVDFFKISPSLVENFDVDPYHEKKGLRGQWDNPHHWPTKNNLKLYAVFTPAQLFGRHCFAAEKKKPNDKKRVEKLNEAIELFWLKINDIKELNKNEFIKKLHFISSVDRGDEDRDSEYQREVEIASAIKLPVGPQPPPARKKSRKGEDWGKDPRIAKAVIKDHKYLCELDQSHQTFVSKITGQNYVEAHHLIPMNLQGEFPHSLDVPANVIPLCPNCHRRFHHAIPSERNQIIKISYGRRKSQLEQAGIFIDLDALFEQYK